MKPLRELYPLVLVDIALISIDEKGLRVLLVQRAQEPELRRWAPPGGILQLEVNQSLEVAARLVLRDKVSMDIPYLEEVCSFSGPDCDPRGWSISVLSYALLPSDRVHALEKNKVEALEWADAAKPVHRMAFDHAVQLARVERRALPSHLMPERFTLSEFQCTCEAILGRPLDKSVFRRRIKGATDLVEVDDFVRGGGSDQRSCTRPVRASPGHRKLGPEESFLTTLRSTSYLLTHGAPVTEHSINCCSNLAIFAHLCAKLNKRSHRQCFLRLKLCVENSSWQNIEGPLVKIERVETKLVFMLKQTKNIGI